MKPRKYNGPPPARSEGTTSSPGQDQSAPPGILNPADEVEILIAPRIPRRWLRVAFKLAPGADAARVALDAAWFVTRMRAADKRLRLTLDGEKSRAAGGELVLIFAPVCGGSLAAEWLEEVKPIASDLAAGVDGAEITSVEVVSEE